MINLRRRRAAEWTMERIEEWNVGRKLAALGAVGLVGLTVARDLVLAVTPQADEAAKQTLGKLTDDAVAQWKILLDDRGLEPGMTAAIAEAGKEYAAHLQALARDAGTITACSPAPPRPNGTAGRPRRRRPSYLPRK